MERREREAMARAWLCLNKRATIMACAKESEHTVELPEKVGKSRVLVVGGTGRVGGSTAVALSKLCPNLRIVVAGRNRSPRTSLRLLTKNINSNFSA